MTSDNGKLMALTGKKQSVPGKVWGLSKSVPTLISFLLMVTRWKDLSVIGAIPSMFKTKPRESSSVDSIPFVMKSGIVYKNAL